MSPEELKGRARRIADEVLTQGDLAVADELFSPACIHHASRPLESGAEGIKAWVTELRRTFPDLRAIVEVELVEGSWAAQLLTLAGTEGAAPDGGAARGRPATWQAMEVLRIGHGDRFVEHWCLWDQHDLSRQLAAGPAAGKESP